MTHLPNAIEAYTVIVLACQGRLLLLQRSATKRSFPNRWTGIGGRIEPDEYEEIRSAALRELYEESGIGIDSVECFGLRRVVLAARPGYPLTLLIYYTGHLSDLVTPDCPEGVLTWVDPQQLSEIDIIETSRPVIPLLAQDMQRDPAGLEPVKLGVSVFLPSGAYQGVVWGQ